MRNTFKKGLNGLEFNKFMNAFIPEDGKVDIIAKESRLIPIGKKDDEMALASVFLTSLTLIKEFRKLVFEQINMPKIGKVYCFTEVSFPELFQDSSKTKRRFDGLLLVVSNGKIKDSAIFEMKSGNDKIDKEQILLYLEMAKELKIDRLISVSNQFVTSPTNYPEDIVEKKVNLYHLSWKFIETIGEILFLNNDLNIEDVDQQNIMREILRYFKDCAGIKSFDKMNSAWKDVSSSLCSSLSIVDPKLNDKYELVVKDWIQEEKDLALKLSLKLSEQNYTPVTCCSKSKLSMNDCISNQLTELKNNRILESILKIRNAISPLTISVRFQDKTILQVMSLTVPEGTSNKKVNFVRKYLNKAKKSNCENFDLLINEIKIILRTKGKHEDILFNCKDFMDSDKTVISKDIEIKRVDIAMESDLGRSFYSSAKFISILEEKVLRFYVYVMQYFENWKKPSPKVPTVKKKENILDSLEDSKNIDNLNSSFEDLN